LRAGRFLLFGRGLLNAFGIALFGTASTMPAAFLNLLNASAPSIISAVRRFTIIVPFQTRILLSFAPVNLDLSSVRAKLARSQEHAQALKNEVRAWMDRRPYSVVQKANADSSRYSIVIRINEPALFQRWSLIFADALNSLRNALDHLVYAIACHEAAPNLPAKEGKLRFPITNSRTNFDGELSRGSLGNISDPVRTAIELAQPYNRPHEKVPPLLGILRNLNNADKHKLVQLVYGTINTGDVGFVGNQIPTGSVWKVIPNPGEIEDGTEILAMVCDRSAPDMKFDRTIFDVVLAVRHGKRDPSGPDWSDRTDIFALYTEIATEVRRIIYEVSSKV
jgi:hypothetical protein